MRFQDETTVPREPTLAERRARQQAARREREEAAAEYAADEASRTKRKRIMIGAGVTVGVVALIAVGYSVANSTQDVQARCVDDNNVVVDDSNCATPAASNTYHSGGVGFFPVFIGSGGRQYHYNYGGSGNIGQVASGGTTVVPKNANVSTPSGKTISRGGLGVSSGSSGSSSGGSKGGSSGSSGS
ncbi:hypothetical protein [Pseudonocardia acidicola]|uniref:Uncharacterized protein n=1 Tax=Pseudonocardia acidicola TaxID=2724939 RepID=A0ABX1SIS9_9PSEU|nr:hypothetical protein [Pseudonocardia acidicola]NMI01472.1 hypothetical protein [Pseudonocardia acidicola]